jgi:hypothetical protein
VRRSRPPTGYFSETAPTRFVPITPIAEQLTHPIPASLLS